MRQICEQDFAIRFMDTVSDDAVAGDIGVVEQTCRTRKHVFCVMGGPCRPYQPDASGAA
jgi:hypothetical protein